MCVYVLFVTSKFIYGLVGSYDVRLYVLAPLFFYALDKFTDGKYQASILHVTQYCKTVLLSAFITDALKFAKINSYTIFHLQGLNWGNQNPGNMLSLDVEIGHCGGTITSEWRTGYGPPDCSIWPMHAAPRPACCGMNNLSAVVLGWSLVFHWICCGVPQKQHGE